jgi:hypothetical protein
MSRTFRVYLENEMASLIKYKLYFRYRHARLHVRYDDDLIVNKISWVKNTRKLTRIAKIYLIMQIYFIPTQGNYSVLVSAMLTHLILLD